jgi:hypothetical protein
VRPLLVAVACVVAGLAAGAIWTWAQADRYRADARVLVRPASARIVPAVEALAESSLVETNVAQTLRLSSPPDISAKRGDGGVLSVSVDAGSRERARQIDAEAVVILLQKVQQRFGTAGVSATVLDPAHAAEQTSPTAGRNLLITGLIGLAAGLAAAVALRRSPYVGAAADPAAERRLRARIDEVARREVALAQKAGKLAAREQALAKRTRGTVEPEPPRVVPSLAVEPEGQELSAASTEPEPAAAAAAEGAHERPRGRWNLTDIERLVSARTDVSPERAEEWRMYLQLLRSHASVDGTLPAGFDALVNDVFADLAPELAEGSSAKA